MRGAFTQSRLINLTRWNVATTVILLNVLISLFSSAYDDVSSILHPPHVIKLMDYSYRSLTMLKHSTSPSSLERQLV